MIGRNKLYNFIFIFGTVLIITSTVIFSFGIPKIDIKIDKTESELDALNFETNIFNQLQIIAHSDYNLGKYLKPLNPLATDIIDDVITEIKNSIISAYRLKYGEIINVQKVDNLYPTNITPTDKDVDYLLSKVDELNEDPTYYNNKISEIKKYRDDKAKMLGLGILLQIIGLVLINIREIIKTNKDAQHGIFNPQTK